MSMNPDDSRTRRTSAEVLKNLDKRTDDSFTGPGIPDLVPDKRLSEDFMHKHKEHLERLVKIQLVTDDQAPKANFVSSAGVWGFHLPHTGIRFEHPNSFFSRTKQEGVLSMDDVAGESLEAPPLKPSISLKRGDTAQLSVEEEEMFPALFSWMHGGNKVSLTGSFTNWSVSGAIPMIKTAGRLFSCIVYLPRGVHRYKFIVDDKVWHYCPRQLQEVDRRGNVNNVLNMTDFDPDNLNRLAAHQLVYGTFIYPQTDWSQEIPENNEVTADFPAATPILLDTLSGTAGQIHDMSGFSAVLQHTIVKRSKILRPDTCKSDSLGSDIVAISINIPCEHSNTGSPDPRITSLTIFSTPNETDEIDTSNIPELFEEWVEHDDNKSYLLGQWYDSDD